MGRRIAVPTYLSFFCAFGLIIYLDHSRYLGLPFYWDELGQFVPAALDLFRDGSLVPHSAVPNVHPPGVMAWLAAIWSLTGFSIISTRAAMLALATCGVMFCFLLAIQLCRGLPGVPAFFALLLLLCDPLFYTQAMLAQLDMPAMVFGLAGLLLFLQRRHGAAALACTALALAKETGIVLPLILGLALAVQRGRARQGAWYVAPFLVLTAWLVLLKHTTGYWFGDPGFTHYNVNYALHPVRIAVSLLRRIYYFFVADFRWGGTLAIAAALKRRIFTGPGWRIVTLFVVAHILLVSVLGGAELERYLLPVLPLFYIATAAAWTVIPALWRNVSTVVMALGLLAGLFVNPPYPFPYENNLAVADFVELQRSAAQYLERRYATEIIYTAWPLTAALRSPDFGYVEQGLKASETSDLHASTLSRLDPSQVRVLVLYSRTWEPAGGVLQYAWVRRFLAHFYDYEPQLTSEQCWARLRLRQIMRWTRRGQWIEVYARDGPDRGPKGHPSNTIAYDR